MHSKAQIETIANLIRSLGFAKPILVDEKNEIIAGHGTTLAALALKLKEVPVVVARGWTEDQKRLYRIADNAVALQSTWNEEMLKVEIHDLGVAGIDLALTGFDQDELVDLGVEGGMPDADPNEELEPPADPVTRLGDVWQLGEHRLICGDSTDAKVVEKVLAGAAPHLMATDPPYGVKYEPGWRDDAGVGSAGSAKGKVMNDDRADWREAWALFPGHVAYVWHGGLHTAIVHESLVAAEFGVRAQIVWVKTRPVLSRGHYHWQHEPALFAVKKGKPDGWQAPLNSPAPQADDPLARFAEDHAIATYAVADGHTGEWVGDRKQSTVWHIEHLKSDTGHGTQKPIECMRRPIANNSKVGDSVYDPFLGSGTTLIAAESLRRRCYGVELDPAYCDVVILRWEKFTGKVAKLIGHKTGGYADVAKERKPKRGKKAAGNSGEPVRG